MSVYVCIIVKCQGTQEEAIRTGVLGSWEMLGTKLGTSVRAVWAPNHYVWASSSCGTEENLLVFCLCWESHLQSVCKQRKKKKKSLSIYAYLRPSMQSPIPLCLALNIEYHFPGIEHVCDWQQHASGGCQVQLLPSCLQGLCIASGWAYVVLSNHAARFLLFILCYRNDDCSSLSATEIR